MFVSIFLRISAVCLLAGSFVYAAPESPNVILIMTDDQGYGDLSITGNDIIETPHMDSLAKNGAWLKQFYVSPVCTPTRAHLMTGRYAFRTRAIDTYLGRAVMEPEEVTIAEVLSEAGYATGIFGKWHLGDYYPTRPIDQGFDEAIVHMGGGLRQPSNPPEGERYHDPILYHNGEPKRYEGYCTDIYFDEAADYIEKQAKAEKPFFIYLPTNAPHGPFDEPPNREEFEALCEKLSSDKNTNRAGFYSMIKNVDDNIGRLNAKLQDLNIADDTIVIFLTDNGPAGGGSSGPFRGAKGQIYQGGIRTVCFLQYPKAVEAGSSVAFNAAHIDLMPTILDFCGVDAPADVRLDGKSVRPLIAEKGVTKTMGWPDRHLFLQWHRGDEPVRYQKFAAIGPQGKWKLLKDQKRGRRAQKEPGFELYDLENDIGETKDVAAEHPEIVERLKKEYDKWFDDVTNTRDPNFGIPPIVIGSDHQKTVVLTPQDKRVDGTDDGGWKATGHFQVDLVREGPYSMHIRLMDEVAEKAKVNLSLEIDGETWNETVTVHRGLATATLGEVTFPVTGKGVFRATVEGGDWKTGPHVHQVTLK